MIARLRGLLAEKDFPWVVLDVGGVGYLVEVPLSTYESLPALQVDTVLRTEMVVREDALLLYGFASDAEKQLFRLLLKVNGVGPKLALAILSSVSVSAFVQAVRDKDLNLLVKVPGVGKKTAERLLLELANGVMSLTGVLASSTVGGGVVAVVEDQRSLLSAQVVQALQGLGYKPVEASERAQQAWLEGASLSELIKRALQVAV